MCGSSNPIGNAASTVGNGLKDVANVPGNIIFGQTPPSPQSQVNSISPQLSAMQQQQAQAAVDFGNNLPAYEKQQQNSAADASRQSLAQSLAGTTANSNARGMLYGSYNAGAQAQDVAKNQADLATTNANINTNAQNELSGMQSQALGTGLAMNQSQQQENDAAYQMALAQQLSNNQLFGSLLKGGGSAAGLLAAG